MPKSTAQIVKVRTGYRVKYYAANGELLTISEVLKSKLNAWKNIKAMVKLCNDKMKVGD